MDVDYRLAFDMAPVGLVLSRNRTMVDCNRHVCEMFGASREVLINRMESRDHFMPSSLLDSQFDTLENLEPDEQGIVVDNAEPIDVIVADLIERLSSPGREVGTGR